MPLPAVGDMPTIHVIGIGEVAVMLIGAVAVVVVTWLAIWAMECGRIGRRRVLERLRSAALPSTEDAE